MIYFHGHVSIMSKPYHHVRKELCLTRAPYREGRKPTAVKVYTVNQESKYLLVQGVPTVGAKTELVKLFDSFGDIQEVRTLDDYPSERFSEVYLISFKRIQSARIAKRRLDDWSFYGGVLHVCYAPEYETVQETRDKLQDRRKTIASKIKQFKRDGTYSSRFKETSSETITSLSEDQQITSTNFEPVNGQEHPKVIQTDFQGQRTCYDSISRPIHSHPSTNQIQNQQNVNLDTVSNQNQFLNARFRPPYQNIPVEMKQINNLREGLNHPQNDLTEQRLLQLPSPPTQSNMVQHQSTVTQNYGFARVPSTHSGFPADFDARLSKAETTFAKNTELNSESDLDSGHSDTEKDKSIQDKINEHLKKDEVVIKSFTQKGAVPRFIPRQMKNKLKPSETAVNFQDSVFKTTNKDEISKELRRNAFTLREVQGPEYNNAIEEKGPVLQIASVEQSVKEIRKRVSQFSDRNATDQPTKKQKALGDET